MAAWPAAAGEAGAGERSRPAAARPADQAERPGRQTETPTLSRGTGAAKPPSAQVSLHEVPAQIRGPDVTLIAGEERTVYEYRQNGQLRMIKVVPKFGPAYYLTPRDPTRGFGDLEQADSLIAEWVLREF